MAGSYRRALCPFISHDSLYSDIACIHWGYSDCTEFAAHQFNDAVVNSTTSSGVQRWGQDTHRALFAHQILSGSLLGCMSDRTVDHGGDDSTVNVGHFSPTYMDQTAGPSYRQIIEVNPAIGTGESTSLFLVCVIWMVLSQSHVSTSSLYGPVRTPLGSLETCSQISTQTTPSHGPLGVMTKC